MIDKEKLVEYLKIVDSYNNGKSGFIRNLIANINQGYFDLEENENE